MSDKKPKSRRTSLASVIVLLLLIVAAVALFFNRQWVLDEIAYMTYKPSSLMESFVEQASMNAKGKFLFYASQPSLQDKTAFNQSCPSHNASMAVLGCYDGRYIYIYNITNPQLSGIRAETAAYEMLHAAYKRLDSSDRDRLDTLIEAEYARQATTKTDATVAYFAQYEPGERDDELFSVIATQFSSISPQLEAYYSRYFNDRQQLVTLYKQYSSVFTNLEDQSNTLHDEITSLNTKIQTDTANYNQANAQLSEDIQTFNTESQSGTMSQTSFNNQRASLEQRIAALDAERNTINDEIDTYNNLIEQYNALAVQTQQLNASVNSNLSQTPSLQ